MEIFRDSQSVWSKSRASNTTYQITYPLEEDLPVIGLGSNFFLIKFQKEENMNNHEGLWFIFNHFLSMRKWEP